MLNLRSNEVVKASFLYIRQDLIITYDLNFGLARI